VSEETLRASDAERDTAVRALTTHYADGRLDRAEFDERVGTALAARTRRELDALFADLPGPSSAAAVAPYDPAAPAAAAGTAGRPAFRRGPAVGFPVLLLVPVLLVLSVGAVVHGAPPFPLIALLLILRGRGRRWNRQARPWG
jgi:hypothetical protein